MLSNFYTDVKRFFNWSWSIFLARLELVAGFIVGAVGAIDWSGFANIDFGAGFSRNQTIWIAVGLIIKGIISEIGRRQGTVTTVNDQLVAENIAKKAKIEVK